MTRCATALVASVPLPLPPAGLARLFSRWPPRLTGPTASATGGAGKAIG